MKDKNISQTDMKNMLVSLKEKNFSQHSAQNGNIFVAVNNNSGTINAPSFNIYYNIEKPFMPAQISQEYYNLFVIGVEEYEKNYFFVEPDRAVSKYERTAPEIVEQFGSLNDWAVAQIKTFPSIFAAESRFINYQIDPNQKAYLGFVKKVKVQQNNLIKIHFEKLQSVSQQTLLNLMSELEIVGRPRCSELERTHWAIKNINLIEILEDVGINMLNF